MFLVSSARMFPDKCQGRSALMFPDSSARMCPDSSARMFLYKSARMCLASSAEMFRPRSARMFPDRSAAMFRGSSASRSPSRCATPRSPRMEENKRNTSVKKIPREIFIFTPPPFPHHSQQQMLKTKSSFLVNLQLIIYQDITIFISWHYYFNIRHYDTRKYLKYNIKTE